MRRLLVPALLAAAASFAAPAGAAETCLPNDPPLRVCASVVECQGGCHVEFYVDPQCGGGTPAVGCDRIDKLYIVLPSS